MLDYNNTDSRKLFREIRNFNGHTANPSTSKHLSGTTYEDDTLLEGWASFLARSAPAVPQAPRITTRGRPFLHNGQSGGSVKKNPENSRTR